MQVYVKSLGKDKVVCVRAQIVAVRYNTDDNVTVYKTYTRVRCFIAHGENGFPTKD